jgi:2-polyprenyl-3-methyl-5-hydroxy-6-metoxy-1,4-benzoquinol methylase
MNLKKIKRCRVCQSKELETVINLGYQYLQGYFKKKNRQDKKKFIEKKYLTELVRCNPQKDKKACGLVQLSISIPSNVLYKKYFYRSGINSTMRGHLKKLSVQINSFFTNIKRVNILDIGCNDGTLLNFFSKKYNKFGIDPSDSFPKSGIKNINFINDFFPSIKLKKISKNIKFNIITSIAMFYDLESPKKFVKKINDFLHDDGIWIFEVSYMPEMLKLNSFDTICHEHLEYYSLNVIKNILTHNNMKLIKVELNQSNGGSIRCFVVKNQCNKFQIKENIKEIKNLLDRENKLFLNTKKPYLKFAKNVKKIKKDLQKLIKNLNSQKKKIHVYGASTKGNTILQYCGIDNKLIEYASDRNLEKDGLKTLGSNISIISETKSRKLKPNYYLALPWHFKKEFIKREKKFLKEGGKFIFPLPKVEVI